VASWGSIRKVIEGDGERAPRHEEGRDQNFRSTSRKARAPQPLKSTVESLTRRGLKKAHQLGGPAMGTSFSTVAKRFLQREGSRRGMAFSLKKTKHKEYHLELKKG